MRIAFLLAIHFLANCVAFSQDADIAPEVKALLDKIKEDEAPSWTYEELASNSDLIVVATIVHKKQVDPGIVGKTDLDGDSIRRVSNTLRILSVLKGESKHEGQVITTEWVPHTVAIGFKSRFAVLRERMLLPNLTAVEIGGKIIDWGMNESFGKNEVVPEYLLYLKHSGHENIFVPVTGQRWAGASVRLLNN